MKRPRRILGVFLCLACAASAQQPSPAELPRATGAVELSILNVDVIVTGKDGRPVRELAATDFQVRLDGKPAEVTNFLEVRPSQEEAARVPRAETAAPAEAASPTGAFTEVTRETRRFEIAPKDFERAKTSHFAYTFEIETRSLENRVSVGVLDDVGKTSGFLLAELHDVKVAPAR